MRILITALALLAMATPSGSAATKPAYSPLPVAWVARPSDQRTTLPLVTVGRLPTSAKSPVNRGALDKQFYTSFRDNQVGMNDLDDPNAANFARDKLKLLPAMENVELVVAVAVPELPQISVTVGPLLADGNRLSLTLSLWKLDSTPDQSKTFNARRLQMLYLPSLPAGQYQLQVQWRIMTPGRHDNGSIYVCMGYKTADLPFKVLSSGKQLQEQVEAPSLAFDALRPASIPDDARADVESYQAPWLTTARRFSDIGDAQEGLSIGTCEPFKFLRGDPSQWQKRSALPDLTPSTSAHSTYAMLIAPSMSIGEWASVEEIRWRDDVVTIHCSYWTDEDIRTRNVRYHPMLLVQLVPPGYRAATPEVTPPGHYNVRVVWHKLVAPKSGGWYREDSDDFEKVAFDVE